MKRIILLFAAFVLCFSQAGLAYPAGADIGARIAADLLRDSGVYVGAGIAFPPPMLNACDNTATTCNKFTVDSDMGSVEPILIVGYDFNKFVGIEGSWERLGRYKLTNATGTAFIGTIQASALTLGVKGGYKFHFGLSVFGKLGLAQVRNQYMPDPGSVLTINNSHQSTGALVGAGVQYDFNDAIGIRFMIEDVSFNDPAFKGNLTAGHIMAIFRL